jgi:hypothetical protein
MAPGETGQSEAGAIAKPQGAERLEYKGKRFIGVVTGGRGVLEDEVEAREGAGHVGCDHACSHFGCRASVGGLSLCLSLGQQRHCRCASVIKRVAVAALLPTFLRNVRMHKAD